MQNLIATYANADGDTVELIARAGKIVAKPEGGRARALTPAALAELDADLNDGVARWVRRPSVEGFDLLIAARG